MLQLSFTYEARLAAGPTVDVRGMLDNPIRIAVQGVGDWTRRAIRPDLVALDEQLASDGHAGICALYIGLEPYPPGWLIGRPELDRLPRQDRHRAFEAMDTWREHLSPNEDYRQREDRALAEHLDTNPVDMAIVATPDSSHADDVRFWLGWHRGKRPLTPIILVEKPLTDSAYTARVLLQDIKHIAEENEEAVVVLPIDHYLFYLADLLTQDNLDQIDRLVGPVKSIDFSMTESKQIESHRLPSLGAGMLFDMAIHALGTIAQFCTPGSLAREEVLERGKHPFHDFDELRDRRYFADTAGELSFRMLPRRSEAPVDVYVRYGKLTQADAKFLQFTGETGVTARFDLSANPEMIDGYPYGGIIVGRMVTSRGSGDVSDPYSRNEAIFFKEPKVIPRDPKPWTRHGLVVEALAFGDIEFFRRNFVLLDDAARMIDKLELFREKIVGIKPFPHVFPTWQRKSGIPGERSGGPGPDMGEVPIR